VYADSGNKYRIVVLSGPNKAVSNDATLSVMDVTAPTISLNGGSPVTVSQNGSWTDPGANATDDKDGAITPIRSGTFDITTPGTYTLTYTATDKAGHSNSVQRTVNVVAVWVKKDFKTISNVSRAILKNDVLYFAEASDQELWLQKLGSTGTIIAETSYPGFPYNGLSLAVGSDGTTLFVGSIQVIASWNGSTWTVVDTIMDWNSVGGFAMHIGAGNRPYIASMDNSTFAERVRKFVSAGNWSIVGYDEEIPLGTGGAHDQHFCIVAGGPAVFTIGVDYTTPVISTANLNGNAWNVVNISPGASGDQRTNVQIISSGKSVYAGFALGDGSAPKVFAWSGTSWTNLSYPENSTTGVAGFSIGCSPAPSSVVYAAYIEGTGPINNVVIKKYEGGSWKNVPQTGNGVAFTTDADQIQIVPGTNKCYAVTIKGAAQQLSIWSIDSN
jgi:hypothetical protein